MHLAKRPAKIGNAIQSRAELHGEDSVTAIDIALTDIMLSRDELNEIMREPAASAALFNGTEDKLLEPLFKHIRPLQLAEKIEGASIVITHGVEAETIRLAPVKLAKIKPEPKIGGMTAMSCTVQATPDLDEDLAHLLGRLNSSVEAEIDGGQFGAQQELPLTEASNDDEAPRDVTRIIDPKQEQLNAETERQLGEALRGLDEKAA